ncbi:MAG: hypothetical protein J7J20_06835 [Desulfurococcales archaeon]|nr:hypothetical protein [Desulfurococcales archaeon]
MSSDTSRRVRTKTLIFFTSYSEDDAKKVLSYIKSRYKILEERQSIVVRELYYVSIEGRADELNELLKDKVLWHKIDVIEFK